MKPGANQYEALTQNLPPGFAMVRRALGAKPASRKTRIDASGYFHPVPVAGRERPPGACCAAGAGCVPRCHGRGGVFAVTRACGPLVMLLYAALAVHLRLAHGRAGGHVVIRLKTVDILRVRCRWITCSISLSCLISSALTSE